MSILDEADHLTVERGYFYYLGNRVMNIKQTNKNIYESDVEGSENNKYHIVLDMIDPIQSTCTCPYAEGHRICKHMIATYFSINDEEADDFGSWLESETVDEDFERDYFHDDDEYEDDDYSFEVPFCFDELLDHYLNQLSTEELKEHLKKELEKDKERTFYLYLSSEYQQFLKNNHNELTCLERIKTRISTLLKHVNYNYYKPSVPLLTKEDKDMILQYYDKNKTFAESLNRLLLNPKLAIYHQYAWIINFYKTKLNDQEKDNYIHQLDDYFQLFKHYSIKNQIPKVNILKSIYLLSHFSYDERVESIIKNAKYDQYIIFVMRKTQNKKALYHKFQKHVQNQQYKNKKEIPHIYKCFYQENQNNIEIFYEYLYYDTLFNKNKESFLRLKSSPDFMKYVDRLLQETKDDDVLEIVYASLNQIDQLYHLLIQRDLDYLFFRHINILKEKYAQELYNRFTLKIDDILMKGLGRPIYREAAKYIASIYQLDDDHYYYQQLMSELKHSSHAKKPALFDEIDCAIKRL